MFPTEPIAGRPGRKLDEGRAGGGGIRVWRYEGTVIRVEAASRPEFPHALRRGSRSKEVGVRAKEKMDGIIGVGDSCPSRGGRWSGGGKGRAPMGWEGGEDEVKAEEGILGERGSSEVGSMDGI